MAEALDGLDMCSGPCDWCREGDDVTGPNLETLLSVIHDEARQDSGFWVEKHLAEHVTKLLIQNQDLKNECDHLNHEIAGLEAKLNVDDEAEEHPTGEPVK